jgi:hypothetical protein
MRLEVVVLQAKIYGQTFHLTLELRKYSYHVEFGIRRVNDGSGGCHCGCCFSGCLLSFLTTVFSSRIHTNTIKLLDSLFQMILLI